VAGGIQTRVTFEEPSPYIFPLISISTGLPGESTSILLLFTGKI
jgi:hypothetical protein